MTIDPALRDRRARNAVALVVCAVLALVHLVPFMPAGVAASADLHLFLVGITDAAAALDEGQFPLRVAPNLNGRDRTMTFQCYANLPFTLAGALHHTLERNPYAAWKLVVYLTLVAGGWNAYRLVWRWTRRPWASVAAAAVFLSAPYLFCDLWDRGALAELMGLCLLPLAVRATWGCFARPGAARVVGCAAAWAAVALSHNVVYLYGATFVGLFMVSFARPRRPMVRRYARLAAAAALHGSLVVWYFAPQLAVVSGLRISEPPPDPHPLKFLAPLDVILWPTVRTAAGVSIPRLAVQVGWVVLAGVLAAAAAALRPGVGRFRRGLILRLLFVWVLAFVVLWQPVDFWPYLPRQYKFVQFTFRMLGFTAVFGALLAGLGLAAWATTRGSDGPRPRRGPPGRLLAGVAGAVALTCWLYYPELDYKPRGSGPALVGLAPRTTWADYEMIQIPAGPLPAGVTGEMNEDQAQAARRRPSGTRFTIRVNEPTRVTLPIAYYPGLLRVTADKKPIAYGQHHRLTTIVLPRGKHRVDVAFVGVPWANRVSAAGAAVAAGVLVATRYRRRRVRSRGTGF